MPQRAGVKYVESFFFHQFGCEFGDKGLADLNDDELGALRETLDEHQLEMRSIYAGGNTAEEWVRMYEAGQELVWAFWRESPNRSIGIYWIVWARLPA